MLTVVRKRSKKTSRQKQLECPEADFKEKDFKDIKMIFMGKMLVNKMKHLEKYKSF